MIFCLLKRAAKIEQYFYTHNLFFIFFKFCPIKINIFPATNAPKLQISQNQLIKLLSFPINAYKTRVMIDLGRLVAGAACPSIHRKKSVLISDSFITTTTTLPSGFRNAVLIS